MAATVRDRYAALVSNGLLEWDAAQAAVAEKLTELSQNLEDSAGAVQSGFFGWLFHEPEPPARGVYLWGDVGRGKTLLLDLFFEAAPLHKKRRTHFHEFMTDVHARIFQQRNGMRRDGKAADAVPQVADAIADETKLLCLDEFQVTDIADAMILGRLFERLFQRGVVLATSSNVAPRELYRDGLNRALFVPFIDLLEQHTETVHLAARTDFRLEKLGGRPIWHVPADAAGRAALDAAFADLSGAAEAPPLELRVQGRRVAIPMAARGVARASFSDLCEKPLGAADYVALAAAVHTLVLDAVPQLGPTRRNETRRFINLVDALYDARVKLIASAATRPENLWQGCGETSYEAQAFPRTASRLAEMQSQSYLALPHGHATPSGDTGGIVET